MIIPNIRQHRDAVSFVCRADGVVAVDAGVRRASTCDHQCRRVTQMDLSASLYHWLWLERSDAFLPLTPPLALNQSSGQDIWVWLGA